MDLQKNKRFLFFNLYFFQVCSAQGEPLQYLAFKGRFWFSILRPGLFF